MTTPLIQGGRPLLRFRLLGFPVHIDITFVIIVGILGYYPGVSLPGIALWLVIATVAILVHELGHAVLARAAGAEPSIALAGLGGVTTYLPPKPLSRARQVGISLAGPVTGLVLGGALLGYGRLVGVEPGTLAEDAYIAAVFTTLGWGLLNLLPILPLDGGQVLQELLPGEPAVRMRRAAAVSIVTGVGVAVIALSFGYTFGALLAAFFVVSNALTLRQPRPEPAPPDTPQTRIVAALWEGNVGEAESLLASQPADAIDPAVRAAVLALSTDRETGRALLAEQASTRYDRLISGLVPLTDALLHDWPQVNEVLNGTNRAQVPPQVVLRVQEVAFQAGAFAESARIGEQFLDLGAEFGPQLAYNAACGWARAGDAERGIAAFRNSAELGFGDLRKIDTDEDLAQLRKHSEYFAIREIVRRTALGEAPA